MKLNFLIIIRTRKDYIGLKSLKITFNKYHIKMWVNIFNTIRNKRFVTISVTEKMPIKIIVRNNNNKNHIINMFWITEVVPWFLFQHSELPLIVKKYFFKIIM